MARTRTIKLPVCNVPRGGVHLEPGKKDGRGGTSTDKDRHRLIVKLPNPDIEPTPATATLFLPPSDPSTPSECHQFEDCVSMRRGAATVHTVTQEPTELVDYPEVILPKPAHCHYRGSSIRAIRGGQGQLFASHTEITPAEACIVLDPDEDIRTDCQGIRGYEYFPVLDNSILVPGTKMEVTHRFKTKRFQYAVNCGHGWYRTCSMTGGVVTEVIGDYDHEECHYKVEIQGFEYLCWPTDFVPYSVGDWVFVVSRNDPCERICEFDRETTDPNDEGGEEPVSQLARVLKLINDLRNTFGHPPLYRNQLLDQAAEKHCDDMAGHGFIGHTGTDGSTYDQRISATGYGEGADEYSFGENVGGYADTAQVIFDAWKASPGHYANMVRGVYLECGLAVRRGSNGVTYWVNTFGYDGTAAGGGGMPAVGDFVILPLKIGDVQA